MLFIERVKVRNFKSIGRCDVRLRNLTLLVGRNGAGKSNFLDALRFIADALDQPLDHAIRQRGGLDGVRRRSPGQPHDFGVTIQFRLPGEVRGDYLFEIASRGSGSFEVKQEELSITAGLFADGVRAPRGAASFRVERGEIKRCSVSNPPPAPSDRLYLVNLSGLPVFREAYEALAGMAFYHLDPIQMRDHQAPMAGSRLAADGRNIASVVDRMHREAPDRLNTVREYISRIVPGVVDVEREQVGNRETLVFKQEVQGSPHPWSFHASSMSDGTLRALGTLVALYQTRGVHGRSPRLVGIEEPEIALHPAAASLLLSAIRSASEERQVLLTTHSPDLLDSKELTPDEILAVTSTGNESHIAALDDVGAEALRDRLYTAGELLRLDQLQPDPAAGPEFDQLRLFGP